MQKRSTSLFKTTRGNVVVSSVLRPTLQATSGGAFGEAPSDNFRHHVDAPAACLGRRSRSAALRSFASWLRPIRNFRASRSGSSAVEFAIVAAPFLAILLGTLKLALIFIVDIGLNGATGSLATPDPHRPGASSRDGRHHIQRRGTGPRRPRPATRSRSFPPRPASNNCRLAYGFSPHLTRAPWRPSNSP